MDNFWKKKVGWKKAGDPNQVIVDGTHYHIGSETDSVCRGHAGAAWKIKFNDGREVYTTNLWCQGEIDCPEARAILQDNAVFIWPADDRCLTLDPELPF